MANSIRTAKSGSDWTSAELMDYNIISQKQSAEEFFGYAPNTIPDIIDPAFTDADLPANETLNDSTYRLIQYLSLATNPHRSQEPAVGDFAKELLRVLGFEKRGTLLRSRYAIPLTICGDTARVAQTDVCLVHGTSTILLVIQEGKTAISKRNPEAQVIAEAIATFQYNNDARLDMEPLESRDHDHPRYHHNRHTSYFLQNFRHATTQRRCNIRSIPS